MERVAPAGSFFSPALALKILYALILLLLAYNYAADLTSGVSVHYGEGPTLDQAMRLTRGENIYRHDIENSPYTVNLYGPLYYLLQWPFLLFSGPTLLFGQLISIASHLLSALFAGLIVHKLTGSNTGRAIATLAALAVPLAGGGMPLYRVDVLAQALSLAGIYIGIASRSRREDALSALLFAAAVYTKLTYGLAGPAAVFFYHLLCGRHRQAFTWAAILAGMILLCLAAMQWLTQGGFAFNVLTGNILDYSLLRALDFLKIAYIQAAIALCALPQLWQLKTLPREARLFAALYFTFATIAAMSAGRIGANYGYFGEWQMSLALLLGIVMPPFIARGFTLYSGLLWAQMALFGYFLMASTYHQYLRNHGDGLLELKEAIAAEEGIVLADDFLGLLPLAGKPVYFEACAMTQLSHAGRWRQDAFVQELRDGKFAMILMGEEALRKDRWTPEMLDAIQARYRLDKRTGQMDIWRRNP